MIAVSQEITFLQLINGQALDIIAFMQSQISLSFYTAGTSKA